MSAFIPSFLLRSWTLSRARGALVEGDCELALEFLAHPSLALSKRAERLRAQVLGSLWRVAARKSRSGRTDSVVRLIQLVSREDPQSAEVWSRRLLPETVPVQPVPAASASRVSSVQSGAPHFQLAIDDVGEFLVACKPSLILGHTRGGRADLPFFADLESEHARLVLEESFHGGPRWHLEALTDQAFKLDNDVASGERVVLSDGDEVQLGANFAFQFLAPDPSSSSAVLKLLHGAECDGASRVLLLAEGEAGRVRMGSRTSRHFVVPNLEHDVTLRLEGRELRVQSQDPLTARPESSAIGTPSSDLRLPCPPAERVVFLGSPGSQGAKVRAPFSFSVSPRTSG